MNNLFFTSDQHFFHRNIIEYSNRPFDSVEEMNEILIQNWNAIVGNNDWIYTLGDFSFGTIEQNIEIVKYLNGNKVFILGNHDKNINKEFLSYFRKVKRIHEITNVKPNIVLSHYAMRVWNKQHYGTWQLYGHSHGTLPESEYMKAMDVGVDCHPNYSPFHYDEIREILDNRYYFNPKYQEWIF